MEPQYSVISPEAVIGRDVRMHGFVNIYGAARIGDECVIGAFVEIQPGVVLGNRVKISSHSFLCTGVEIEDGAFIGHGVMFANDKYPRSVDEEGRLVRHWDTRVLPVRVGRRAVVGSGSTVLGGVSIGAGALVGAGSVVTRDVPPHVVVAGNPARFMKHLLPGEARPGIGQG